ncbi:MAG: hypothetical protein JSU93_00250 [Methanobacteriota archaeon]|nr:MAG: hypothetical protein JSU93_00250 [Euryarchaeota archaeon]
MRNRTLLAIAAAFCVIVPVSSLCAADQSNPPPEPPVEKDWAVYIYCGADNDYEVAALFALDQCIKGLKAAEDAAQEGEGDPISVHVVMYLDGQGSGNTVVYEVTSEGASSVDLMAEGEYDSSDPNTLVEFLTEAMYHYPGDNTLLVVKNGHAWCGVCPDEESQDAKYLMPIHDLAEALMDEGVVESGGVDVLALDGDNMASIEVIYELRNACKYFVGSQQDVPLDGLPYYLFLKDLASETAIPDHAEVARSMVANYVSYYNNTEGKKIGLEHQLSNSQMAVTGSAFRMGEGGANIQPIVDAFNNTLNYMLYGILPEGMAEYAESQGVDVEEKLAQWMYPDITTGDPVWSWVPLSRNNISSARDCALIGKMSDQAGYEWLPDVYTWQWSLSALSNYDAYGDSDPPSGDTPLRPDLDELNDPFIRLLLEDFMTVFGYEEEGIYRGIFDPTRIDPDGALVWLAQSQIFDRSGNSFPHGLNIWFPPTWVQWESLDNTRTRTYLYDGSNVELPAEYYCIDCPFDYNDIDLDFVATTAWMDYFASYYDSRWTIYGNPDAPRANPLW